MLAGIAGPADVVPRCRERVDREQRGDRASRDQAGDQRGDAPDPKRPAQVVRRRKARVVEVATAVEDHGFSASGKSSRISLATLMVAASDMGLINSDVVAAGAAAPALISATLRSWFACK